MFKNSTKQNKLYNCVLFYNCKTNLNEVTVKAILSVELPENNKQ